MRQAVRKEVAADAQDSAELEALFDPAFYQKHVDHVFSRVFGEA